MLGKQLLLYIAVVAAHSNGCIDGVCENETDDSLGLLHLRQESGKDAYSYRRRKSYSYRRRRKSTSYIPLTGFIGKGNAQFPTPARIGVELQVQGSNGKLSDPQLLMLDTGSSTLVFCDSSLGSKKLEFDNYASCAFYGGSSCAKDPTGKDCPGYVGYMFKGNVAFSGGADVPYATTEYHKRQWMKNVPYATMEYHKDMLCSNDQGSGLFGIAYKYMNRGYQIPKGGNPMDLWNVGCNEQYDQIEGALMQTVRAQAAPHLIGIYWSGKMGKHEGALYLGKSAISNEHYDAKRAMSVWSRNFSYFTVMMYEIVYVPASGQNYSLVVDQTCFNSDTCYMDSGSPSVIIPSGFQTLIDQHKDGVLKFVIFPPEDQYKTIAVDDYPTVTLDVAALLSAGQLSYSDNENVLGIPYFAQYYTVFDVSGGSTQIVKM
eukprot:gb/GFBE01014384.1/.p1 GENE.gb/GFBE01014384.1/~~gb/GFBE01014384.1/.p1  ORF type:complete len:430 (+),score=73.71 gb/GFBE01014384.1/:1-1290(+)